MKPLVYVAGKLSDMPVGYLRNMRCMMGYAHRISRLGLAIAVPCLDYSMALAHNLEIDEFMGNNLEIMLRCDAVALVPGWETSVGTKMEIDIAGARGIPILYDYEAVGVYAAHHSREHDPDIQEHLNETTKHYKGAL